MAIVSALLFAYLVVGVPVLGKARYDRFKARAAHDPHARIAYYRRGMATKWALSAIVIALYFANGRDARIQLVADNADAAGFLLLLVLVGLGGAIIKWRLGSPRRRAKLAKAITGFADVIPRTPDERRVWVAAAVTAGVTEELLYRGFVLSAIANAFPTYTATQCILWSSVAFALAHIYQGPKGVVLTGAVGFVLGVVAVNTGLLAAMAVHSLIDLRILVVPGAFFDPAPPDDAVAS
jgi:membrane protease YdiL (CAAX protease family)